MVDAKDIRVLLEENPFFEGMPGAVLNELSGCGKLARFKKGEFLLREGDAADMFYLIRQGCVAVESHIPAAGAVSVARVEGGGIAGFSWLFPPYRNTFDAHALSDVSTVALNGKCLRGKAEKDHELGYQLMARFTQVMLERLEATRRQMLDVYARGRTTDAAAS